MNTRSPSFPLVVATVLALGTSSCDLTVGSPDGLPSPVEPVRVGSLPFNSTSFDDAGPDGPYDLWDVARDFGSQPVYIHRSKPRGPHGVVDSVGLNVFGLDVELSRKSLGLRAHVADSSDVGFGACGSAIRVTYPEGEVGRGVGWYWKLGGGRTDTPVRSPIMGLEAGGGYPDISFAFRVKFGEDLEFVRTGKLAGVGGGMANTGGLKPTGTDGWSVRFVWNADEVPEPDRANAGLYVYHPHQPDDFGQTLPLVFNPPQAVIRAGDPRLYDAETEEPIDFTDERFTFAQFEAGQWVHLEVRVRLNTPGEHDGSVYAWVNDELVLNLGGFAFRGQFASDDELLARWVLMDSIYGGDTADFAPVKDEEIFFDDFVVSESYIGSAYAAALCEAGLSTSRPISEDRPCTTCN